MAVESSRTQHLNNMFSFLPSFMPVEVKPTHYIVPLDSDEIDPNLSCLFHSLFCFCYRHFIKRTQEHSSCSADITDNILTLKLKLEYIKKSFLDQNDNVREEMRKKHSTYKRIFYIVVISISSSYTVSC